MSRFRRRSQVKPMAAEVLEPRCLLTDATGTLASDNAPAEDAAPLTGDVVIGPDLWDDAGLTLQQIGDLLHVFRTDTQSDVLPPLLISPLTRLHIIGRPDVADTLTIELSCGDPMVTNGIVTFDGGSGHATDCLRLVNASTGQNWADDSVDYYPAMDSSGAIQVGGYLELIDGGASCHFQLRYQNVSVIQDWFTSGSTDSNGYSGSRNVFFGSESNQIVYDYLNDDGVSQLQDMTTATTIQFSTRTSNVSDPIALSQDNSSRADLTIKTGAGDDHLVVNQSRPLPPQWDGSSGLMGDFFLVNGDDGNDSLINNTDHRWLVSGGNGNDTLIGGSGNDDLRGDEGDDCLVGRDGNDILNGDNRDHGGNDWLQGDAGDDTLYGQDGANTLWAGDGNDTLEKNSLSDVLHWGDPPGTKRKPNAPVAPPTSTTVDHSATTNDGGIVSDDDNVIPNNGEDFFDSPSFGDVLLIGQGIATVEIEDREWAEFDTASFDSAFGELADSEPEDGEGPEPTTLADGDDLAANGDTNSADVGEQLELDTALSNDFLESLGQPPLAS